MPAQKQRTVNRVRDWAESVRENIIKGYAFFTEERFEWINWNPWRFGHLVFYPDITSIREKGIKSLCQELAGVEEQMHQLNEKGGEMIAPYLKMPLPQSEEDYESFGRERSRLVRAESLPWLEDERFKLFDAEYQKLQRKSEQLLARNFQIPGIERIRIDTEVTDSSIPFFLRERVRGVISRMKSSYGFFTGEGKVLRKWHPWVYEPLIIDRYFHPFRDKNVMMLFEDLFSLDPEMFRLNKAGAEIIAPYLKRKPPQSQEDYESLGRKRGRLKRSEPLPWLADDRFQSFKATYQELLHKAEALTEQAIHKLSEIFSEDLFFEHEFGDPQAKDLLDRSIGADEKNALKWLNKALTYGTTGIYAQRAYHELGEIHENLGQQEKAREYYELALQAYGKVMTPRTYLLLGLLCIDLNDEKAGKEYLQKAFAHDADEFPGYEEEYARGKQLLAKS